MSARRSFRHLVVLGTALTAILLFPARAWLTEHLRAASACSCVPPATPALARDAAATVFQGLVVDVADRPGPVVFEVLRVYKGTLGKRITFQVTGSSCEKDVRKGMTYLVYTGTPLSLAYCSRTALVDAAKEDLDYLGSGSSPTDSPSSGVPEVSKARGCGGCSVGAVVTDRWGTLVGLAASVALIRRRRAVQSSTARK